MLCPKRAGKPYGIQFIKPDTAGTVKLRLMGGNPKAPPGSHNSGPRLWSHDGRAGGTKRFAPLRGNPNPVKKSDRGYTLSKNRTSAKAFGKLRQAERLAGVPGHASVVVLGAVGRSNSGTVSGDEPSHTGSCYLSARALMTLSVISSRGLM